MPLFVSLIDAEVICSILMRVPAIPWAAKLGRFNINYASMSNIKKEWKPEKQMINPHRPIHRTYLSFYTDSHILPSSSSGLHQGSIIKSTIICFIYRLSRRGDGLILIMPNIRPYLNPNENSLI
jgi:hypothetical protein